MSEKVRLCGACGGPDGHEPWCPRTATLTQPKTHMPIWTEPDIERLYREWHSVRSRARLRRLHKAISDVLGIDGSQDSSGEVGHG